jgi:hypothetical protein
LFTAPLLVIILLFYAADVERPAHPSSNRYPGASLNHVQEAEKNILISSAAIY